MYFYNRAPFAPMPRLPSRCLPRSWNTPGDGGDEMKTSGCVCVCEMKTCWITPPPTCLGDFHQAGFQERPIVARIDWHHSHTHSPQHSLD